MTGTKWVLHLAEGEPLVVRWSDPTVWGATGREHVRREARALRLLAGSPLPVAQLIATDPDGEQTGGPANVMTWLPGRVRLDRLSPAAITAWAASAVSVHRHRVPDALRPPVFSFRGSAEPEVPDWAGRPGLWRQAIDLFLAGPPPTPYGLLHRDFHLGNVLWQDDAVTGLVDWAETSWGPADLDVAHACSDLAMLHSTDDAETFRAAYVGQGGRLDPDRRPRASGWSATSSASCPTPAHILVSVAAGSARPVRRRRPARAGGPARHDPPRRLRSR